MQGVPQPARQFVHGLTNLSGGLSLKEAATASALKAMPPEEALQIVASLITAPRVGWPEGTMVLSLVIRVLLTETFAPVAGQLERMASLAQHRLVSLFLTDGTPAREYDSDAASRADAKLFIEPLGRLKTMARLTTDPDQLGKFAVVSNASVVREVLVNPRLTEALVVRIASRRPARPEPLREIALSHRWGILPEVRKALVFNPYLPPVIGCKLVPLLAQGDLEMLTGDSHVHPGLREMAQALTET